MLEYGDKGIANNNDKTSKSANDLDNTESDGEITLDAIVNDVRLVELPFHIVYFLMFCFHIFIVD